MSRERVVKRFAHCGLRRPRELASLRYPCQTAIYSATTKSSTTRLSARPVAVAAAKFRPLSEPHPAKNTNCERMTASVPPPPPLHAIPPCVETTMQPTVVSKLFPRRLDYDDGYHDFDVDTPSVGSASCVCLRKRHGSILWKVAHSFFENCAFISLFVHD